MLSGQFAPTGSVRRVCWVRGAGEKVGYGVGVPTATCWTRGVRDEAYRNAVIVQLGGLFLWLVHAEHG